MGLQAIYTEPDVSDKHRIYPYLVRRIAITGPNQVWCSDITYTHFKTGFLHPLAILDWAAQEVLALRLSNTLDASFCVKALGEIAQYRKPEIMNTDQRSKYTGAVWIMTLTKADIKISMDGPPANWITLSSKGCGGHLSRKLFICMKFLRVLRKMGQKKQLSFTIQSALT